MLKETFQAEGKMIPVVSLALHEGKNNEVVNV